MATKNFTQFDLRTPLLTSDYIVGYTTNGLAELKTTVQDIINLVPVSDSTIIQNASANWNSVYSYTNANSSLDQSARSFVNSNSANILNSYKGSNWVFANSATELSVTSVVNSTSANWNSVYSYTNANSSLDQSARSFVNSNSANILNSYKGSNWVFANSATELSVTSVVNSTSANWNSVYSNVNANSATYATILFSNNKFLPLSGGQITGSLNITNNLLVGGNTTITGNLTGNNIFAKTFTTDKPQTIYQGERRDLTINNATTVSQERLGRLTMLTIFNAGATSVLNLSESENNRFLEGDVVGIWARQALSFTVTYTPYGGSAVTVSTFTGSGGYNTGSVALYYKNGTFITQTFDEQNIKGIASELRIESIQPNDPGEPFSTIGRGSFVHALTLNAGHPKFTNGSDHFHLLHNGTGGNWQTLNGGYNWTPQRITQHTLAFRGAETTANIVAAYGASLTANQVTPPYGVYPNQASNYLTLWTSSYSSSLTVGKIVYFSVSPAGSENASLRKIGFTASSFPAKIISVNDIGSAESNADIPAGNTLPGTAVKHFRVQPLNLAVDNWLGAALLSNGSLRYSTVPSFTNSITNTGEVIRLPGDTLLVPDTQSTSLSAKGGYNYVSMRNGCELVFDLSLTPLLSTRQPFLYEGLPVIVLLSEITSLTATNYNGLTPNSAKCQYGLPVDSTSGSAYLGEFTNSVGGYLQQTYDGYIYRSTPTQVIIRLGQIRGTEESRMQKHASPNIDYFVGRSGIGITTSTFAKSLPPGGLSAVEFNGYRLTGVSSDNRYGSWANCSTGAVYTLPPIMKSGIEFSSFPAISSSDLQLFVYAGNKDPVHRPVAGMQLFSYERYPNIQPELKETGAVVSKFALGPSCEGFDRDTAVVGFGSTAYHYRSMAIGHRVETLSAQEIAIGIDDSVFRVGLSSLSISPAMLSSNGVDTFLKIKNDKGPLYGLKLQLL